MVIIEPLALSGTLFELVTFCALGIEASLCTRGSMGR